MCNCLFLPKGIRLVAIDNSTYIYLNVSFEAKKYQKEALLFHLRIFYVFMKYVTFNDDLKHVYV